MDEDFEAWEDDDTPNDADIDAAAESWMELQVDRLLELRAFRKLAQTARDRQREPEAVSRRRNLKFELLRFRGWLLDASPEMEYETAWPTYRPDAPLCLPEHDMLFLAYEGPGYLPLCLRNYGGLILANNVATLLEGTRLCRRAVLGADRQASSSADLYGSECGEQCRQAPAMLDTPYAVLAWHYPLRYTARPNVTKKRLLWALDIAARIGMDEVVLTRGGGDPAGFAVFDDGDVVDAVLRSPVPVIAALGHTPDVPAVARVATACLAVPHDVRHLDRMRFQIAYGHREAALEEALRFLAHSGFALG
jgi:hypothetical protein